MLLIKGNLAVKLILGVALFLLLAKSPIIIRDDHKFVISSFLLSVLLAYDTIVLKTKYRLSYGILGLILFLVFVFTTSIFAINPLLALYRSTIVFLFFGFILWLSNTELDYKYVTSIFRYLLYFTCFSSLLYIITTKFLLFNYHNAVGSNVNSFSTFLLCLIPFGLVINNSNRKSALLNAFILLIALFTFIFNGAKGCLILFSLFVIILFLRKLEFGKKTIITICLLITLAIAAFFFNQYDFSDSLLQLTNTGLLSRIASSWNSIDVWLSNSVIGTGLGNSFIQFGSNPDINANYLERHNPHLIQVDRDHNLYTAYLSEIGVMGVFMISGFFIFVIQSIRKSFNFTLVISLFLYLGTSFFYLSNNSYYNHFSSVQFIAVLIIGMIIRNDSKVLNGSFLLNYSALIGSLWTLSFFVWNSLAYNNYINCNQILDESGKEKLQCYEKMNGNGLNRLGINVSESLNWKIGHQYFLNNEYENALIYFDKAVIIHPTNAELLLEKGDANFQLGRYDEAYSIYQDLYSRYIDYYPVNQRMAYFKIKMNDFDGAKKHISKMFRLWNFQKDDTHILEFYYFVEKFKFDGIDLEFVENWNSVVFNGNKNLRSVKEKKTIIRKLNSIIELVLSQVNKDQWEDYIKFKIDNRIGFLNKTTCSNCSNSYCNELFELFSTCYRDQLLFDYYVKNEVVGKGVYDTKKSAIDKFRKSVVNLEEECSSINISNILSLVY